MKGRKKIHKFQFVDEKKQREKLESIPKIVEKKKTEIMKLSVCVAMVIIINGALIATVDAVLGKFQFYGCN